MQQVLNFIKLHQPNPFRFPFWNKTDNKAVLPNNQVTSSISYFAETGLTCDMEHIGDSSLKHRAEN